MRGGAPLQMDAQDDTTANKAGAALSDPASLRSVVPPVRPVQRVAAQRGGRGRFRIGAVVAVVIVGVLGAVIGVLVSSGSQEQWPAELQIVDVVVSGEEREFRCPGGEVRVSAVVTTNGGAGTIDAEWTAAETKAVSVEVAEATTSTRFEFVVPLAGDQPFDGVVSFQVTGPESSPSQTFGFEYLCG